MAIQIDAPRARPTGPRLPVWREFASGGPRQLGVQPAASAAAEARRPAGLSEAQLFHAYRNALVPPEDLA